jgi:hypothetical protein
LIIQFAAEDIKEALKKQGSLSIVKRSIQEMKAHTSISLKMAKSSIKQNPHE